MTARVDAHVHLWDRSRHPQPWIDPQAMSAIDRDFLVRDLAVVADEAVVVQAVASAAESLHLLDLSRANVVIRAVVGWVDLTAPDVPDQLARLQDAPGGDALRGVRHVVQAEPDPDWLDRPDVRTGLAAVAAAGLTYDLLVDSRSLPSAVRTVRAVPGLRFVLDHLGKPPVATGELTPWAQLLSELARSANVTAKLSGLVTEAHWTAWEPADLRPFVDVALDVLGPDRLMFGSDWPVCLLASSYETWVGTVGDLVGQLSSDEQGAVLGTTARTVYRLPGPN